LNVTQQGHEGNKRMKTNRSTLAAATTALFFLILAACTNAAMAQHEPSKGAQGMPGALGTIEFKPPDWKGNVTTYWKDTDGVAPGVAGCHIGVSQDGRPNGRSFGEACQSNQILVESNPGADEIHPHQDDTGHPDTFDCNAWCVGTGGGRAGVCTATQGPPPCASSARCVCN
jgi:hypothetical protein